MASTTSSRSAPVPCGWAANGARMAGRAGGGHGSNCGFLGCSVRRRTTPFPFLPSTGAMRLPIVACISLPRLERADDSGRARPCRSSSCRAIGALDIGPWSVTEPPALSHAVCSSADIPDRYIRCTITDVSILFAMLWLCSENCTGDVRTLRLVRRWCCRSRSTRGVLRAALQTRVTYGSTRRGNRLVQQKLVIQMRKP